MTLAALSPLYTWWLLAFAVLVFIVKVVCPVVRRRQADDWPPPFMHERVDETIYWLDPLPWTRVA